MLNTNILKNANRYACLVAEPETSDLTQTEEKEQILVGVVDATALRDQNVLQYFPPDADEYLYISGIAVSETFRFFFISFFIYFSSHSSD